MLSQALSPGLVMFKQSSTALLANQGSGGRIGSTEPLPSNENTTSQMPSENRGGIAGSASSVAWQPMLRLGGKDASRLW